MQNENFNIQEEEKEDGTGGSGLRYVVIILIILVIVAVAIVWAGSNTMVDDQGVGSETDNGAEQMNDGDSPESMTQEERNGELIGLINDPSPFTDQEFAYVKELMSASEGGLSDFGLTDEQLSALDQKMTVALERQRAESGN